MNMTKATALTLAALMAGAACFGRDLYSNDFATRSSFRAMPGSQWHTATYACPASLAYAFAMTNVACTALSPYGDLSKVQDGWTFSIASEKRGNIDFWTRTDDGSDNPFACFSSRTTSASGQQVMAMQPLYNVFSNGTVRISVDARAPTKVYSGYDGAFLRMELVPQSVLDSGATSYGFTPVYIGFSEDCKVITPVGYDGYGATKYSDDRIPSSGSFDRTRWYRIVTDIHLGTGTYACNVYDMGTAQPSLDTPTPAETYGTASGLTRPISATGPVSGLGIRMKYSTRYSLVDGAAATTNCPCADNIRLWWNASDSAASFTDDDLFYENDFSTRRVRTFARATKTASYAGTLVGTDAETYAFWDVATRVVPGSAANLTTSTTGGRDDWRRVNDGSGAKNANVVATEEDGGNVLAVVRSTGTTEYYAKVYHPIGTSMSDGFVKLEYDFRTPSAWVNWNNSKIFTVYLGGDAIRSGGAYLVRTGYSANGDSKFYPVVFRAGSKEVQTGTELSALTWYRASVVADLANSRFDFTIRRLGANSGSVNRAVDGSPIVSLQNVGFNPNGSGPVTTYSVIGFDYGDTFEKAQLLDNVRIWKGTDGANWDLVYQNDFNRRVRYGVQTVQEAPLLGGRVNGAGLDGWIRRGAGDATMLIRNAANPCATIEGEGSFAHAVQTFDKPVTKGKVVVRADIRPPTRMTDCAGHPASIFVGGDEYAQGEVCAAAGSRAFTDAAFGHFGFAVSGDLTALRYDRQGAKFYAEDGGGEHVGASVLSGDALMKWYRFEATFNLDAGTWTVTVYDQGAAQPAFDAANGTPVASFENLTFKYSDPSGFTAIGIAGGGTAGAAPLEADKKGVLFDNLKVVGSDDATIFVIR